MNKIYYISLRSVVRSVSALAVTLSLVAGILALFAHQPAIAAYNPEINYQGKLTNASNVAVANGDYNMEFKLYDAVSAGNLLWTETRTGANKVTVTNGLFSVMLGEVTAFGSSFDWNKTLFLTVNIGGTGTPSWDGEMTPRKKIGAVPAAFLATTLKGTGTIDIINTASNQAIIGYDGSNKLSVGVASNGFTTLTVAGGAPGMNITGGNVGIGSATASAKLHVTATTEQLRMGYDASNYLTATVGSTGSTVFDLVGTSPTFTFSKEVNASILNTNSVSNISPNGLVIASYNNAMRLGAYNIPVEIQGNGSTRLLVAHNTADVYLADAVVSATPTSTTLNGGGGSGTNIAGGTLNFAGGKGTGNASGGDISFQTSDAGASGTALQSLTTKAILKATGNFGMGTTAPDKALEINSATGANLRLTYNDSNGSATNYADLLMSSGGDLTIAPSGSDTSITGTLAVSTSVATPSLITASGALGITPAAGSNLNINLSTTGDFAVNTNDLYVDTSTSFVGVGTASPNSSITWGASGSLFDVSAVGLAGSAGVVMHAGSAGQETAFGLASVGGFYMDVAGSSTAANNYLAFRTEESSSQYSPTERWRMTSAGHFIAGADNSYDIGASGATRPRTGYFGTSVIGPTINATTALQFNGTDINTAGTLTNVAYENQANSFTVAQSIAVQSATALTVARTGSNYAFQVDTNTASSETGLKVTSAAATGGLALAVISSGTNENLTIDAKGSGTITLGNSSTGNLVLGGATGDILLGGGLGSTGCTVTNSSGALACNGAVTGSNLSGTNTGDQTITLTGDVTGSGTGSFATTIGSDKVLESHLKAVNAATDEDCLTYESSVGDFEWEACGGGSQTPWASDISAAGYDLRDLSNLEFQATTGAPLGSVVAIFSDNSGDMNANVLSGKTFNVQVNAGDEYVFSSSTLDMNSNTITNAGTINSQTISSAANFTGTVAVATSVSTPSIITASGALGITPAAGSNLNISLSTTGDFVVNTNQLYVDTSASSVGIGTTGPDRKLDVLDASNPQIRLTTTDGTVYSDVQNTANANMVITGSTLASSSAKQYGLQIAPIVNQTSTASYTGLDVNVTETGTTSLNGLNRLADLRVGGSSKLAVSNNGSLLLQNASNIVTPYSSIGSFQNHLVRSQEFDNASWDKASVTAPTANTQTAPDGSTSAESLATSGSGGSVCQFTSTAPGSDTFTFSVWARSASGTQNFDMRIDAGATSCGTANSTTGTAVTHTATTSWQRFTVTETFSGASNFVKVRIYPGGTGGTGTIYAWGAQLDKASTASGYAFTTGAALTNNNAGQTILSNFATASGYTYGGRHVINLEGAISASSSTVGQLIRVVDNATGTDDTATVRALEVQSYSGSNINGVNTAVAAFGYTFGVHAVSTGQANEAAQPAAVFADLDNGSAPTQGNAIRAYSNNLTSADLVSFYHESTGFTGTGLEMNFGNNTGGSFTGNFIDLQKVGVSKFKVDNKGVAFVNLNSTEVTTNGLCHGGADVDAATDTTREVVACSAAPGDIAEWYETEADVAAADIVVMGDDTFTYTEQDFNALTGTATGTTSTHTINILEKTYRAYDNRLFGVISTSPYQTFGKAVRDGGAQNPQPVALKGRVLVKVTNENGPIRAGDYITSSENFGGYAMKATRSGHVVGQALSDFSGDSGTVMIFVEVGFQSIGNTIVLDAPDFDGINLQSGTEDLTSNSASTFTIQQQATGESDAVSNILQLQTGDANRFMVSSTGATSILSNLDCSADESACPSVLNVTQANTELMNIDARGTLTLAGTIFIKDDSFAGSVTTGPDGLAEITFNYHLGTGKPVVQLTTEAQLPVFAQIVEFKTDEAGNYTGFVMKTFDLISSPVQAIVHYTVTGKQEGYITFGEFSDEVVDDPVSGDGDPLIVEDGSESADENVGVVIEGGEVAGESSGAGTVGGGDSGAEGGGSESGTESAVENTTEQSPPPVE